MQKLHGSAPEAAAPRSCCTETNTCHRALLPNRVNHESTRKPQSFCLPFVAGLWKIMSVISCSYNRLLPGSSGPRILCASWNPTYNKKHTDQKGFQCTNASANTGCHCFRSWEIDCCLTKFKQTLHREAIRPLLHAFGTWLPFYPFNIAQKDFRKNECTRDWISNQNLMKSTSYFLTLKWLHCKVICPMLH